MHPDLTKSPDWEPELGHQQIGWLVGDDKVNMQVIRRQPSGLRGVCDPPYTIRVYTVLL